MDSKGWQAVDDGYGNLYYYNHFWGDSAWRHPHPTLQSLPNNLEIPPRMEAVRQQQKEQQQKQQQKQQQEMQQEQQQEMQQEMQQQSQKQLTRPFEYKRDYHSHHRRMPICR